MKHSVILAFCLLLLVFPPVLAEDKRVSVPLAGSPMMGPESAPVTIFEFIDFQ